LTFRTFWILTICIFGLLEVALQDAGVLDLDFFVQTFSVAPWYPELN